MPKPIIETTYKPLFFLLFLNLPIFGALFAQSSGEAELPVMSVPKTTDFVVTGDGMSEEWSKTEWVELTRRPNPMDERAGETIRTRIKMLYSDTGLYVLFENEDDLLSATYESDFEELWWEDVAEAFFWTDESEGPHYFEYEISPLNYELPLLVSKIDGELLHWIPFANSYRDERLIRHQTSVDGLKESGAEIESWSAEFFIPFKLLHPLKNIYPESGDRWRANFYRIDYDEGQARWSWSPFRDNFHDIEQFGTIVFE